MTRNRPRPMPPDHVHPDDGAALRTCEYCGERLGYFHMCGCHFDNSRRGTVAHLDDAAALNLAREGTRQIRAARDRHLRFLDLDDAGAPRCDDFVERRREARSLIWLGFGFGLMLCALLYACAA